jgi:uncharacterized protein (DUF302 family)
MIAAPTLAMDLPLKILVTEHEDGAVSMVSNGAEYIADWREANPCRSAPVMP